MNKILPSFKFKNIALYGIYSKTMSTNISLLNGNIVSKIQIKDL